MKSRGQNGPGFFLPFRQTQAPSLLLFSCNLCALDTYIKLESTNLVILEVEIPDLIDKL